MVIYSHSRISSFEQCRLKFKYRYIDKIIPEVKESIESYLGKAVHNALEWFYLQIKNGEVPTIDELITYYSTTWESKWPSEVIIVNNGANPRDYFNKGVKFLLDYYLKHQPFDDNTIDIEKRIFLDLDEQGNYKIQGFIDRLAYNLKTKQYEIHDYKTANTLPQKKKIKNDRQLALYSIAIKNQYKTQKEVLLVWHFLAHNLNISIRKTNQELQELKTTTLSKIKEIEAAENFPPTKSRLCNWCEYKPICPAWGNSVREIQQKIPFEKFIQKKELDIWD